MQNAFALHPEIGEFQDLGWANWTYHAINPALGPLNQSRTLRPTA